MGLIGKKRMRGAGLALTLGRVVELEENPSHLKKYHSKISVASVKIQ